MVYNISLTKFRRSIDMLTLRKQSLERPALELCTGSTVSPNNVKTGEISLFNTGLYRIAKNVCVQW